MHFRSFAAWCRKIRFTGTSPLLLTLSRSLCCDSLGRWSLPGHQWNRKLQKLKPHQCCLLMSGSGVILIFLQSQSCRTNHAVNLKSFAWTDLTLIRILRVPFSTLSQENWHLEVSMGIWDLVKPGQAGSSSEHDCMIRMICMQFS